MYCRKIEKIDSSVYSILVGMAMVRGIDVYEINGPDSVSGMYYNYSDEGIKAKVFMVSREDNKEYSLACLLATYVLSKDAKAFVLRDRPGSTEIRQKAYKMAKRLVALLERRCKRK